MELTGYSVADFQEEQKAMFINAMASVLNVSPGAITIISVSEVSAGLAKRRSRRRNTLQTSSGVAVYFKVELTTFTETDTVEEALVTTDTTKIDDIKTKLTNEGLTNVEDVVPPTETNFLACLL